MAKKLKVYVGFTYTHSPQSFRDQMEVLKRSLAEEGYEVIDVFGVSPGNAYYRDIEYAIGGCDIFVAVCDHYATTLGLQIGAAVWKYKIPTLLIASQNSSVAQLLINMVLYTDQCKFFRYKDLVTDVLRWLPETEKAI